MSSPSSQDTVDPAQPSNPHPVDVSQDVQPQVIVPECENIAPVGASMPDIPQISLHQAPSSSNGSNDASGSRTTTQAQGDDEDSTPSSDKSEDKLLKGITDLSFSSNAPSSTKGSSNVQMVPTDAVDATPSLTPSSEDSEEAPVAVEGPVTHIKVAHLIQQAVQSCLGIKPAGRSSGSSPQMEVDSESSKDSSDDSNGKGKDQKALNPSISSSSAIQAAAENIESDSPKESSDTADGKPKASEVTKPIAQLPPTIPSPELDSDSPKDSSEDSASKPNESAILNQSAQQISPGKVQLHDFKKLMALSAVPPILIHDIVNPRSGGSASHSKSEHESMEDESSEPPSKSSLSIAGSPSGFSSDKGQALEAMSPIMDEPNEPGSKSSPSIADSLSGFSSGKALALEAASPRTEDEPNELVSEADESSLSARSPGIAKKKVLHKRVHKEGTESASPHQGMVKEHPELKRQDTLDDVDTIKTDSLTHRLSPETNRQALPEALIEPMVVADDRRGNGAEAPPEIPGPSVSRPVPTSNRRADTEPIRSVSEVLVERRAISEGIHDVRPVDPAVGSPVEQQSESNGDPFCVGDESTTTTTISSSSGGDTSYLEELAAAMEQQDGSSSGHGTQSSVSLNTREEQDVDAYQNWIGVAENLEAGDSERSESTESSRNMEIPQGVLVPIQENDESEKTSSLSGSSSSDKIEAEGKDEGSDLCKEGKDEENSASSADSLDKGKSDEDVDMRVQESLALHTNNEIDNKGSDGAIADNKNDEPKTDLEVKLGNETHESKESSVSGDANKASVSGFVVNLGNEAQRTPKRKREARKSSSKSPNDPEVPSQSEKKYCSELIRPVPSRISRSNSTGSVPPDSIHRIDIASWRKLAAEEALENSDEMDAEPNDVLEVEKKDEDEEEKST